MVFGTSIANKRITKGKHRKREDSGQPDPDTITAGIRAVAFSLVDQN